MKNKLFSVGVYKEINIFEMEVKMCQKIVRNAKNLTEKNYGVRH